MLECLNSAFHDVDGHNAACHGVAVDGLASYKDGIVVTCLQTGGQRRRGQRALRHTVAVSEGAFMTPALPATGSRPVCADVARAIELPSRDSTCACGELDRKAFATAGLCDRTFRLIVYQTFGMTCLTLPNPSRPLEEHASDCTR